MKKMLIIALLGISFHSSAQSTTNTNIGSTTRFLGFSDNFGVSIRTDNATRMWFNPNGSIANSANTSGFVGIGTTNPCSPLHIIGSGAQTTVGWRRGITLSPATSMVWDGGGSRSFILVHLSVVESNFFAGTISNLTPTSAIDYAYTIYANTQLGSTPAGANPLLSTQFYKNVLVQEDNFERFFGVNTINPQRVAHIFDGGANNSTDAQLRLASLSGFTDFRTTLMGNLLINPSAQRVAINNTTEPTANLDINGDARIRNVQAVVPDALFVGNRVGGSQQDLNVRRLDFPGNPNTVLLGNGTFGPVPNSTPNILAEQGVSRTGNIIRLGDVYSNLTPPLNTITPLAVKRQIRLNNRNLIFSGDGNVAIGLDFPQQPTEVFDVDGNARFRRVPAQGGQSLILGLQNGSSTNDVELSRLAFPLDANVFLAGNGTWQPISNSSGFVD